MMLTFCSSIPTHVNEPLFRLFHYYFVAKNLYFDSVPYYFISMKIINFDRQIGYWLLSQSLVCHSLYVVLDKSLKWI